KTVPRNRECHNLGSKHESLHRRPRGSTPELNSARGRSSCMPSEGHDSDLCTFLSLNPDALTRESSVQQLGNFYENTTRPTFQTSIAAHTKISNQPVNTTTMGIPLPQYDHQAWPSTRTQTAPSRQTLAGNAWLRRVAANEEELFLLQMIQNTYEVQLDDHPEMGYRFYMWLLWDYDRL
ncbi:hypothetical protein BO99DRAFT_449220, partial [Aspergillus violaceofuscus CBS 115571]